MGKKIDLVGQTFGRLTVEKEVQSQKYNRYFECKCICGKTKIVSYSNLKSGHTQSCGCILRDLYLSKRKAKKNINKNSRLYRIWTLMKNRTNPNNLQKRHRYFDRGITVCDEWRNSFPIFEKWAIENGYSDELTLDRIDNNKGYNPSNCRWADYLTQENNRENNNRYFYEGKNRTLTEWSRALNINYETLRTRLKNNWTIKDAFTRPVREKRRSF